MAKPDPFHDAAEALTARARSNFERQLAAADERAQQRLDTATAWAEYEAALAAWYAQYGWSYTGTDE